MNIVARSGKTSSQQFARLAELSEFLENRCKALELNKSTQLSKCTSSVNKHHDNNKQSKHAKQAYITTNSQCMFCNKMHPHCTCYELAIASDPQRTEFVKRYRLCYNCLQGHKVQQCRSSSCRTCGQKHHTLLHKGAPQQRHESSNSKNLDEHQLNETAAYCSLKVKPRTQILLSTALVKVCDSHGTFHTCRALLDSCSQAHFVTEDLVKRLNLKRFNLPRHANTRHQQC
jgi:hypothetical protein